MSAIDSSASAGQRAWVNADTLARVRAILLAVSLFFGLTVWIYHSIGAPRGADAPLVRKLRGLGVLTWIYALVQMIDMRFYHSRFVQRRRAAMRIPESVHGWLLGQMLACFGIVYYGFTEDLRWYVAGLVLLGLSFIAFPIRSH